jgi:hypothetical protein
MSKKLGNSHGWLKNGNQPKKVIRMTADTRRGDLSRSGEFRFRCVNEP